MEQRPRLRQVALAAAELEPVASALATELGLREPFHDPGVGEFGLENAVFEIGDTFLEVVAPVRDGTAAGRYIAKRGGDCGYMAIFQVPDTTAARARAAAMGIRVVWQIDLPDISGTHLHPKDVPGAIVSVDTPQPPETWRWAGPRWTGTAPDRPRGGIRGLTVACADAKAAANLWAGLLGIEASGATLELAGGQTVTFDPMPDAEGITAITLAVPDDVRGERDRISVGGISIDFAPLAPDAR